MDGYLPSDTGTTPRGNPLDVARLNEEAALLGRVKRLLRRFNLRPLKGLGQHFLIDEKALMQVVTAAELSAEDTIIEVGPGLGMLTSELAKRARRVIAIEVDSKLALALSQTLSQFPNVEVLQANILEVDPATLVSDISRYKVVANLPYYIASPTLRHFLEAAPKPYLMVVMVQKEVGQSIVAKPGEMSLLSVAIQFYGRPVIIDYVPAKSFYPSPRVDSAILRIDVYEQPAIQMDERRFFEIVRAGFIAPRKQLHNALAQGLGISAEAASNLLSKAKIEQKRRAQSLSLEEWGTLCQALSEESTYLGQSSANPICLCQDKSNP